MAFNPISVLLGQQGLGSLADTDAMNEIVVTAGNPRPDAAMPRYGEEPIRGEIQPRYVLNDDRIAPRPEETQEILPRRGMFGVKGTLRDILGTLGDAFLVQSGNDPVYAPQRDRERVGDAMFGAAQDPLQAAERLAAAGYPQQAQELMAQAQEQAYKQAKLESQEAARRSLIENRKFDNRETGLNRISRWVQAGLPYERIVAGATQYGISPDDLAELGVTPEMSEEDRRQFAAGDMTVNQQVQVPFTERRVAAQEQSVTDRREIAEMQEAGRNRRYTPPQPRQPRAETDSERAVRIGNIPPSRRSPGDQAWYERWQNGTRGSSRRSVPNNRATTGSTRPGWGVARPVN